ncbi:MAG: ribonuclease HII [Candidatus Babeliaceae bacterium]|nr:ribonuclease HII [Candidatus Babeliaceae bacterium]
MAGIKIKSAFRKDFYESEAWAAGKTVVGVDEVGRGCLAGPVVAAAVILPPGTRSPLLRDSKQLGEAELEKAFAWIIKRTRFSVGIIPSWIIDEVNIYRATQCAMSRACAGLLSVSGGSDVAAILIDAMPLGTGEGFPPVYYFIKGESKSRSIAAASIVAKVTRDRIMRNLGELFEPYYFAEHKGYGTEKHRGAVERSGRSIIHRFSYGDFSEEIDEQISLFG